MASDANAMKPFRSLKTRRREPRFFALRAARALLISTGLAAALPVSAADTALGGADDTNTAGGTTATAAAAVSASCARPAVMFNRWQENWSALANPCVPKQPFDSLKYIPLFGNPDAYISLGMVLRERLEMNDAPLFGLGSGRDDT